MVLAAVATAASAASETSNKVVVSTEGAVKGVFSSVGALPETGSVAMTACSEVVEAIAGWADIVEDVLWSAALADAGSCTEVVVGALVVRKLSKETPAVAMMLTAAKKADEESMVA